MPPFDPKQCGCQCLSCCKNGTCEKLTQGYCDTDAGYTCDSKNSSACGIAYSSPQQSAFCAIPNPSTWPPVLQTPTANNRAPPHKPAVTTMVTAPRGGQAGQLNSSELVPGIYTVPLPMDNTTFLNEFLPELISADGTVNGHLFSQVRGGRLGPGGPVGTVGADGKRLGQNKRDGCGLLWIAGLGRACVTQRRHDKRCHRRWRERLTVGWQGRCMRLWRRRGCSGAGAGDQRARRMPDAAHKLPKVLKLLEHHA